MHMLSVITLTLLVAYGTNGLLLPEVSGLRGMRNSGVARAGVPSFSWMARDRRGPRPPHRIIDPIEDCFLVTPDEGELFFKSPSNEVSVCGIYMIAEPDKNIELIFNYLDVPCENGGLVAWVDGWELNGKVWPADSWSDDRMVESCGSRPRQVLLSRQNAALLQYRVPAKGKGFSVRIRHVHSARPCDVMLYGASGVHTLRNYGLRRNCSVVSVAPSAVQVLALDVGRASKRITTLEIETGTIHQCAKRGLADRVDIGGSNDLDSTNMEIVDSLCGLNSNEEPRPAQIACGNTIVRLVSNGRYHNSVTVAFQPLGLEDLARADLLCDI